MRPFILTSLQAGKLPRWGLWLLGFLYVAPGLLGRDPWRIFDVADFGVALTLAQGSVTDWLRPSLAGEMVLERGPLTFWLAAVAIRALPVTPPDLVMRSLTGVLVGGAFIAFWYASYLFARRPDVQPADPFGASASRTDYGRAIADSALLLVMACLGLVVRLHESTTTTTQFAMVALFLLGCADALGRPRRGGYLAAFALPAIALADGWPVALCLLGALLFVCAVSQPYRIVCAPLLIRVMGLGLPLALVWVVALNLHSAESQQFARAWLLAPMAEWGAPRAGSVLYLARTLPWFYWPLWPIALWSVLRWRARLTEPAVVLPLATLIALLIPALLANDPKATRLMAASLPLALLAGIGLPTLRRAVVSLIDWFAVMAFTLLGLVIWAYWLALVTGWPPKMAFRASQLAQGSPTQIVIVELVLGALASIAWIALVRWRISRQPPMIWRSVMLSGAGLVLTWFLLMTLWLPAFNHRLSLRDLSQRTSALLPVDYTCAETRNLPPAERASLLHFGKLRMVPEPQQTPSVCNTLLIYDNGPIASIIQPQEPGWNWSGEASVPQISQQRIRVYRRLP